VQDVLKLQVVKRAPKKPADGIKGVVYGRDKPTEPIASDPLTIERLYNVAGHNRVIDLVIEDERPLKVMFQEVQHSPVTGKIIHFDLHAVSLKEKLQTEVPIHLTGEAPAVFTHEGILTTTTDIVQVEAEPLSIPEKFEVDISHLEKVGDHITIGDLKVPQGVELLSDPALVIVKIEPIVEAVEEEPEVPEGEIPPEGAETTEGAETEAESEAAAESDAGGKDTQGKKEE
jgi:large subunit ribosomal protein L25